MAETVRDILGKGFKYEERISVQTITEVITGTIFATCGGAHWGSITQPTLISNYENYFGSPLTRSDNADFAGLAAQYALKSTPLLWFKRITDGTDTKSRLALIKAAQIAKLVGAKPVKNKSYIINEDNNTMKIGVDLGTGSFEDTTITLTSTPGCSSITSDAVIPTTRSNNAADAAYNLTVGTDYINFVIDDTEYRYVAKVEPDVKNLDEPDFLRLVVPASGTQVDSAGKAPSFYTDTPNITPNIGLGTGITNWNEYKPAELQSGYQELGKTGVYTTGLHGLTTGTYNFTITVDGALTPAAVAVAINGETQPAYSDLIDAINAQLSGATAEVIGGDIRFTSDSTGMNSSILLGNGSTNNLFATGAGVGIDALSRETPVSGDDFLYAERFVFALKKYVIIPALIAIKQMSEVDATAFAENLVQVIGNTISLSSTEQGINSKIYIYNFPKFFPLATPQAPLNSLASNTSIDTIIEAMNLALTGKAIVWIDNLTSAMAIGTVASGADQGIKVSTATNNPYLSLGLTATDTGVYGADEISDAGTFEAAYTGADGNKIVINNTLTADGKILTIYFRDNTVGTFFNYSLNVADSNYIGTLMNRDARTYEVVRFTTPTGATSIPAFPTGDMTLSGGTSGVTNLADSDYNSAIEEYRNIDLYEIDILAVPGILSESIVDKIQEICEARKDCFGVVDIPEDKAGLAELGGGIYAAIDWHNGVPGSGRSKKLASKFLSTYYPWLQINDGVDYAWYPPSVRAIGAICGSDKIAGHKMNAPAGPGRTVITDIEGLAQYLREDEKNRLYADELGNNINPIVFNKNRGFFIDGQKNTDRTGGAISRLNVLRTSLYIKKYMYSIAPGFFWSPLTAETFNNMKAQLEILATQLISASAIKSDYVIICDGTLNTATVEADRGLIASFEWTPVRSIEKIKIISIIRDLKVETVIGL